MTEADRHSETGRAWSTAKERLRRSVPATTFTMWIEPLGLAGSRAGTVFLTAPERIRAWVERRYLPLIAEALTRELGRPVSVQLGQGPGSEDSAAPLVEHLNPAYTFDRFVIGDGNYLAHAAALSVAEAPAEAYNPLFLYGPPGLGKTHLLCAIANYLTANASGLTVRYTTAEGFTSQFVTALKSSGIEEFKRRYRDLDVLLVDDVQFLEGKQTTEEEFFHTFNALYESGSQLVFSADRTPGEFSSLAVRLRDRFEWGLTAPIQAPTLSTRLVVLERLVREAGIEIADPAALALLARRVDSNIRKLHGALTRIVAQSSLDSRPLDAELIESVLGPDTASPGTDRVSIETLQDQASEIFSTTVEDLRGPARNRASVRARQAAILLSRELTSHSLPEIGRRFGGRDHSTVHSSLSRARALLDSDPEFAARVNRLRSLVHSRPAALGGRREE